VIKWVDQMQFAMQNTSSDHSLRAREIIFALQNYFCHASIIRIIIILSIYFYLFFGFFMKLD